MLNRDRLAIEQEKMRARKHRKKAWPRRPSVTDEHTYDVALRIMAERMVGYSNRIGFEAVYELAVRNGHKMTIETCEKLRTMFPVDI